MIAALVLSGCCGLGGCAAMLPGNRTPNQMSGQSSNQISNQISWDGLGKPPVEQTDGVRSASRSAKPPQRPRSPAIDTDTTGSVSPMAFTPEWWAREHADEDRVNKSMSICRNC
jgi:hypothetical protein